MRGILRQMAVGEASWLTTVVMRLVGLCLFLASYLIARLCWRLDHVPPLHQPTPIEFGVAGLAVVALSLGIAFSIEGAGLFRLQPLPPRPWVPMKKERR